MENKVRNCLASIEYNDGSLTSLTDHELRNLMWAAKQQDAYEHNKGYKWERINTNPREKAFFEQWLKENEPCGGINSGNGILQDLFINDNHGSSRSVEWIEEITNHERYIVATVIQWLGSNCGMGFLHEALKRVNKTIVDIK